MIDLHAHVLAGIDDGPPDLASALALARAAAAAGTRTIAATPHVSTHYPTRPDQIAAGLADLRAAIADAGIDLDVVPGAEVAASAVAELDDDGLRALALGGGDYLLLESPLSSAAGDIAPAVRRVERAGLRVLLAHPERAPAFQRDPARLAALVAGGVRTSVTASALTGRFGRPARSLAKRMLSEGMAHTIASDAHDLERRPPELRAHLADLDPALVELLTLAAPAAVLAGEPLPLPPLPPSRGRGMFRRWRAG